MTKSRQQDSYCTFNNGKPLSLNIETQKRTEKILKADTKSFGGIRIVCVYACIQSVYSEMRTKTSGKPGLAQPEPKDVIPARYHRPSLDRNFYIKFFVYYDMCLFNFDFIHL